jgi:hypothetical protein
VVGRRFVSTGLPRRPLLAALTCAALAVGVGCGGDDETSPASLKDQLVPASQLRLEVERPFEWDNPIDFTVDGVFLPEGTKHSDAIEEIDDFGFEAGYGELLRPTGGGPDIHFEVAKFDSDDGAADARDYLHQQDLQQPCFAACTVNPEDLDVNGVPGLKGVHQVPLPKAQIPPGAGPPFERFVVEFTIGPYLYIVDAAGDPGDTPPARFARGTKSVYEYASEHTD